MKKLLIVLLVLPFIIGATVSGGRIVTIVHDFSTGINPGVVPYATPQTIAWASNFISPLVGGVQLRSGYVGLLPDPVDPITDTTTAIHVFSPTKDSTYILYAAGGVWHGNQAGRFRVRNPVVVGTAPEVDWLSDFGGQERINAYNYGDSIKIYSASTQVFGWGTRFIRDVAVGDTLVFSDTTAAREIVAVVHDGLLLMSAASDHNGKDTDWTIRRRYDEQAGAPFFTSVGEYAYTGNISTRPQVIFNDNETLYLRALGIVDSFYIDTLYYFSGRYVADSAGTEYTDRDPRRLDGDTLRYTLDPFITWDTTFTQPDADSFNVFLKSFQVVSRRKAWFTNEWRQAIDGAPEAFYVRLGPTSGQNAARAKYLTIAANDDTSLFLNTWFVQDTCLGFDSVAGNAFWNDSLYGGKGLDFDDTLVQSGIVGTWGYIYAAAGTPEPIVQDTATDLLYILGRGAMCFTVDSTLDTADFQNGLYFLRLTADDVGWPAFKLQTEREQGIEVVVIDNWDQPVLSDDDSLISTRAVWAGWAYIQRDQYSQKVYQRVTDYYYNYATAEWAFRNWQPGRYDVGDRIKRSTEYKIRRGKNVYKEQDALYLRKDYAFPIVYTLNNGDTCFFITGASGMLEDIDTVTTANWEIVRARMPNFREMQPSIAGGGLIGWGDTLAVATMSFSESNNPWRFSALNDILVGDPSDPITAAAVYDNQILAFKHNSITSVTNGNLLSAGLGAVGRNAVALHDKWVFFASEDGVYRMERRDYYGYSQVPISRVLDPVYQGWSNQANPTHEVPISIKRQFLENLTLRYNQHDHHLWMWLPNDSIGGLGIALTYNTESGVWDGAQGIPAGAVTAAVVRDTSRLLIGSVDSAYVFALDYTYNDDGDTINGSIRSKPFAIRDDAGRKLRVKLHSLSVTSQALDGAIDSVVVIVRKRADILSAQRDHTFRLGASLTSPTLQQRTEVFYPNQVIIGRDWEWLLYAYGAAAASTYTPIELEFEWIAVEDK